jgi:hypothetical protein
VPQQGSNIRGWRVVSASPRVILVISSAKGVRSREEGMMIVATCQTFTDQITKVVIGVDQHVLYLKVLVQTALE